MDRKRIIFTVTNDLIYDQRMNRICASLSRHGYQVTLIGRKHSRSKPLDRHPYVQKRINCFFEKGKLFYFEYNFRLFWILLFSKFDALCSIDLDTLVAGFMASKLRGKPCIYDAHEYFTEVPEVIERPLVKQVWEKVAAIIIPRLKYNYTVGESLAGILSEKYGSPFEVIRNVPNKQPLQAVSDKKTVSRIILYQGALNAGRGLEPSIKAMQLVDNAVLWLVGEGDLSQSLRQLVDRLGLGEKVIFKGYLRPLQLKELTVQADVGLNLLQNKSLNYYYSLANKAFDYIQAGLPAINMDFPEYRKLNDAFETSILIRELRPEVIAGAIDALFGDDAFYRRLASNCRKAAEYYTWEEEEQKLLRFYSKVFP